MYLCDLADLFRSILLRTTCMSLFMGQINRLVTTEYAYVWVMDGLPVFVRIKHFSTATQFFSTRIII